MKKEDCIFCKVANKKAPAKYRYESKNIVAFDDTDPSAETHILLVPKKHIETFLDLEAKDSNLFMEMVNAAQELIEELKLKDKYRVSFNGGSLQIVPHLHMHLLGGKLIRNYGN